MLSHAGISALKQSLEAQLAELQTLAEIAQQGASTVELDQSKVGRLSRMDALQQQAMNSEQNRRRKIQIGQIHAALKRIARDDYGWCQDCGEEINPQRLKVNPATPWCTGCADSH